MSSDLTEFVTSLRQCIGESSLEDNEVVVMCPYCGYDFGHIVNVFTREGSDPYEGRGGFRGTRVKGSVGSRRACLVVVFEGECGHFYEWRIQQHKGNNFVSVAYVGDVPDHVFVSKPNPRAPFWYRVPVLGWFLCVRNHGIYQQSAPPHSDGSYWCSYCRRDR